MSSATSARSTRETCRPTSASRRSSRADAPTLVLGSSQRRRVGRRRGRGAAGHRRRPPALGRRRRAAVARRVRLARSRDPRGGRAVERRRRPRDVVGGGVVGGGARRPRAARHRARGRLQRTRWSADVCFAGTGPGEVLVGDAKLVGDLAAAHPAGAGSRRWSTSAGAPTSSRRSSAGEPSVDELAPLVKTCAAPAADIIARLTAALDTVQP